MTETKLMTLKFIIEIKMWLFYELTENAKALSSVSKLRDMMIEKMLELKNVLEAVIEKVTFSTQLI